MLFERTQLLPRRQQGRWSPLPRQGWRCAQGWAALPPLSHSSPERLYILSMPALVTADLPNNLPLPRMQLGRPLMMLQTNCTLGTSLSGESPSGKLSCGQAQLCRSAPSQPPSRIVPAYRRAGLERGQRGTKPLPSLCRALGKDA